MNTFSVQNAMPLHLQIAEHLERRITAGELREGERMPTTLELAAEYGVTPVTVQKSLQRLVELDLVDRAPRRGTFVKPHQTANTIGLVFGYSPFRNQSMLYLRLLDLFRRQAETRRINLKIYFDSQEGGSSRALYDVRRDVATGKLKALIAVDRTPELSDWLKRQQEIFWVEPVKMDLFFSTRLGTEYLLRRHYRRIMVVSMYPPDIPYDDWAESFRREQAGFDEATAGCSPDVKAELVRWGQTEIDGYVKGREVFSGPDRPEAIFVHHDVVCRGLLLALMELGLKIPGDVALLTHANAGCEFASPVPLSKVVFDPAEMVESCLRCLEQCHGQLVPGPGVTPKPVMPRLIPGKSCGE